MSNITEGGCTMDFDMWIRISAVVIPIFIIGIITDSVSVLIDKYRIFATTFIALLPLIGIVLITFTVVIFTAMKISENKQVDEGGNA